MDELQNRINVEKAITTVLVTDLLRVGYSLSVYDGGETTVRQSLVAKEVLDALMTTDEDTITVFKDGAFQGAVQLIYGNDGYDVIADYSVSLEADLAHVSDFSENLAEIS